MLLRGTQRDAPARRHHFACPPHHFPPPAFSPDAVLHADTMPSPPPAVRSKQKDIAGKDAEWPRTIAADAERGDARIRRGRSREKGASTLRCYMRRARSMPLQTSACFADTRSKETTCYTGADMRGTPARNTDPPTLCHQLMDVCLPDTRERYQRSATRRRAAAAAQRFARRTPAHAVISFRLPRPTSRRHTSTASQTPFHAVRSPRRETMRERRR